MRDVPETNKKLQIELTTKIELHKKFYANQLTTKILPSMVLIMPFVSE